MSKSCQKLDVILENKGVWKLKFSKTVNNKKCVLKMIIFEGKKNDSDNFWHRKLSLKVRIMQFMTTFTQLTARLKNFLRVWLLVLGLKEGLVECATVCIKSKVILLNMRALIQTRKRIAENFRLDHFSLSFSGPKE